MFKLDRTVILITVFLLLVCGGCYTKLKHPRPMLLADGVDSTGKDYRWEFSDGWYGPSLGNYEKANYFYNIKWWDNFHGINIGYEINDENNCTISNGVPCFPCCNREYSFDLTPEVDHEPIILVQQEKRDNNKNKSIVNSQDDIKDCHKTGKIIQRGRR